MADQVQYESGKVVSLTLAQQPASGMTLFAFDAGEAISTHAAGGDAMAFVLEGEAEITIDGTPNRVTGGHAIICLLYTSILCDAAFFLKFSNLHIFASNIIPLLFLPSPHWFKQYLQ